MASRYPAQRSSHATEQLGLTVALAAGVVLLGATLMTERRQRQRARVRAFPDSAPPRTRRASEPKERTVVGHSVTVNRPRAELFAFWRDFSNLPRFMENIEKVTPGPDGRSVWTIAAPGGFTVDLETEIAEEREGELIAWRSTEASDIDADGRVTFTDGPAGRGTIVLRRGRLSPAGRRGRTLDRKALPARAEHSGPSRTEAVQDADGDRRDRHLLQPQAKAEESRCAH